MRALQTILERVGGLAELAVPDEDLKPPLLEEAPVQAPREPRTTSPFGCHIVLDDPPWAKNVHDMEHSASPGEDESVHADDGLNAAYKAAMDRLADPAARKLLQDAEQAWIVFRDAHLKCAVVGRPITARRSSKVRADLTTNRQRDLESVAIGA